MINKKFVPAKFKYAISCCGILNYVRHIKYKKCSICGKVLKDMRNEVSDNADKT